MRVEVLIGALFLLGQSQVEAEALFPNFYPACEYRQRDFRLLAKGLNDALNFLQAHVQDLVLDAAIGTRILEGQIRILLAADLNLPTKVRSFLLRMLEKSEPISEGIIKQVKDDLKISDAQRNTTLPWVTSSALWEIPKVEAWKPLTDKSNGHEGVSGSVNEAKEIMDEKISDACIGDLFLKCHVSEECAQTFLRKPHSLYSLTHQAIFMMIAKQLSCTSNPEFEGKFSNGGSAGFHDELCSKVLVEANEISDKDFPQQFQDLFAEQVAVCSLAGYSDFLKPEWMYEILFWEKTLSPNSGCFINSDSDLHSADTELALEAGSRVKRSDALISLGDEQCSVHFTAVSMASLAIHLRYFLETCASV